MEVMTMVHDKIDSKTVEETFEDGGEEACPIVLNKTPATMLRREEISIDVKTSSFHDTASTAEVIGSAALMVSTNAADVPWNPTLVAQKPRVKQIPA